MVSSHGGRTSMGAWVLSLFGGEDGRDEEKWCEAEERERGSWGFWKTERKGGIYSGEGA